MTFEGVTVDGEVIPLSESMDLRGRVLRIGWELPKDMSEDDWIRAGRIVPIGDIEKDVSIKRTSVKQLTLFADVTAA